MLHRNSLYLTALTIVLVSSPGVMQTRDFEREIVVMFSAGALQFPENAIADLDQITFSNPAIRAALDNRGITRIQKAFPNFKISDTRAVSRTGEVVELADLSNIYIIPVPDGQGIAELVDDLSAFGEVIYAEPNGLAIPAVVYPNDPLFDSPVSPGIGGHQWNLLNTGQSGGSSGADIDAPEAWDITIGDVGTTIGVVDFGVWNNHEDLLGKVTGDANYGNHGTHVAGIAAANTNNGVGIAGIDWAAQIETQDLTGADDVGVYNAIMDAVNAGSDVLNNSWLLCSNCQNPVPTPRYSITVRLAFANAYKLNVVAAVAMGNYNSATTYYPAGFGQGIIAVGATNRDDLRWDWEGTQGSNSGSHIDVVAPGEDIISTVTYFVGLYGGRYDVFTGTSMATPHISGIAGLLLAQNPNLYNDDIEQVIRISAEDKGVSGFDNLYGDGRVNARKALDLIRPPNVLSQLTASGGTATNPSGQIGVIFYSTPGLADGAYWANRWEVRKTVTFTETYESAPYVWGRGAATDGYSDDNPNYGMGWSGVVGGSVTTTGAELRTYAYQVWEILQNFEVGEYLGWFPTSPSNVLLAYTALGVPQPDPPPGAPTNLQITNLIQLGQPVQLAWNANPEPDINYYRVWRECTDLADPACNLQAIGATAGTSYTDTWVSVEWPFPGVEIFTYYVSAVDDGGNESAKSSPADTWGDWLMKQLGPEIASLPEQYALHPAHPNPFNPATTIQYDLPEPSQVQLVVYDLAGRTVTTLVSGVVNAGYGAALWQGRDGSGRPVPTGVYIYRIIATGLDSGERFTQTRKMVLLK